MTKNKNSFRSGTTDPCREISTLNKKSPFPIPLCILALITLLLTVLFSACGGKSSLKSDKSPEGGAPAPGEFTYTLVNTDTLHVWSSPVTHITESTESAPAETGEVIKICAAANEYEPFQIALTGSGTIRAAFSGFKDLAEGASTSQYQASFSDGKARALAEISESTDVALAADSPALLWFDSYIPKNAKAGTYRGTITISGDASAEIPVELTVFDFALPDEIHYNTHLTVSMANIKQDGDTGDCEKTKTMLFEHRLIVNGGQLWPTGFNYSIVWPSGTFTDEPGEGVYGVAYNAPKYLKGEGWTKPGFPITQAFQFVDNSTPRPSTFNGIARGSDHYGSDAYNTQWKKFLSDLNAYITANGFTGKLYYYVMNEPQNQTDYDLAAYLCKMTRESAPDLKIAVSEEPKAEIAEHASYKCADGKSYDIWIADIQHYNQDYAWQRQKDFGEEVWFYHNDGTPDPYINPIEFTSHGGLHQRLIPWLSWHYRVRGWAYYNSSIFFDNKIPNIRGKLLREGIEDYEYLRIANGDALPTVTATADIDATVDSAAKTLTSYASDDNEFMSLKWRLGQYIEGSLTEAPLYTVASSRERGEYYINFQDPEGSPAASPLIIDGKEYIKIGWSEYNAEDAYGWVGGCVSTTRAMYCYDDAAGFNELQKSALYDDYGKINLFEFDLSAGKYAVTIGAGRAGKGCYDKHNVSVEGVEFLKSYESADVIEVSKEIELSDGKLSIQIGDAVGQYTFLAYLKIVPVD